MTDDLPTPCHPVHLLARSLSSTFKSRWHGTCLSILFTLQTTVLLKRTLFIADSLKQAVGHEAIKLLVNVDEDDYETGRVKLLQNLND